MPGVFLQIFNFVHIDLELSFGVTCAAAQAPAYMVVGTGLDLPGVSLREAVLLAF